MEVKPATPCLEPDRLAELADLTGRGRFADPAWIEIELPAKPIFLQPIRPNQAELPGLPLDPPPKPAQQGYLRGV